MEIPKVVEPKAAPDEAKPVPPEEIAPEAVPLNEPLKNNEDPLEVGEQKAPDEPPKEEKALE